MTQLHELGLGPTWTCGLALVGIFTCPAGGYHPDLVGEENISGNDGRSSRVLLIFPVIQP